MKKQTLILIFQFLIVSFLQAQEKSIIPGTNLKIELEDSFLMDENYPTIYNKYYEISFAELPMINYYTLSEDFGSLETRYAEKGISIKASYQDKIGRYEATFLNLNVTPSVNVITFGDSVFCALVSVTAVDSSIILDDSEIINVLSSIEFHDTKKSALEEHANFVFSDDQNSWTFKTYYSGTFAFQNDETNDGITISQWPPELLISNTIDEVADQFVETIKMNHPNLQIIEEGNIETANFDAYRILLDTKEDGNKGLFYGAIFSSKTSVFFFQGVGKNDDDTKNRFEEFLNNLVLKN